MCLSHYAYYREWATVFVAIVVVVVVLVYVSASKCTHTHTHTRARARTHTHTHRARERARERERESLHNGSESLARNMKTVPYVPVCQFCRSWRVLTVWLRKKHTIQRMFRVSWYPTKKTDYVTYILIERIVLVWISL